MNTSEFHVKLIVSRSYLKNIAKDHHQRFLIHFSKIEIFTLLQFLEELILLKVFEISMKT